MTDLIKSIHDEVRKQIEDSNLKYKTVADQHKSKVAFEVGDKVWVDLPKDRFPKKQSIGKSAL